MERKMTLPTLINRRFPAAGRGRERVSGCRRAFTLVEVLVVMAIIAIIIAATVAVGGYVRTNAQIKNTQSTIKLLELTLQEYKNYKQSGFPPQSNAMSSGDLQFEFQHKDIGNIPSAIVFDPDGLHNVFNWQDYDAYLPDERDDMKKARASIEFLYYFLDEVPACRKMLSRLSEKSVTNDDQDLVTVTVGTPPNTNTLTKPLLEVNDAWQHPIRYQKQGADNFPTLTSAGPDGVFDTADDMISDEF